MQGFPLYNYILCRVFPLAVNCQEFSSVLLGLKDYKFQGFGYNEETCLILDLPPEFLSVPQLFCIVHNKFLDHHH